MKQTPDWKDPSKECPLRGDLECSGCKLELEGECSLRCIAGALMTLARVASELQKPIETTMGEITTGFKRRRGGLSTT